MPKVVPEYKKQPNPKLLNPPAQFSQKKATTTATMDEVAKEVGVSKGALYSYFKSKEEMLQRNLSARAPKI